MAKKAAKLERAIEVLVRADGQGELRDGAELIRAQAEHPDELRAELMEHAMALAVTSGDDISVRIIDVDGIYQLVCGADGSIDQIGDVSPLQPGDDALTEEPASDEVEQSVDEDIAQAGDDTDEGDEDVETDAAAETDDETEQHLREHPDGGYRELFADADGDESSQVQAPQDDDHAVRVPREEMLAPSYDELIADGIDDIEDDPIRSAGLFDDALVDEVPADENVETAVDDEPGAEHPSLLEEAPLSPAEQGHKAAVAAVQQQRQTEATDSDHPEGSKAEEQWAPAFLRDRVQNDPQAAPPSKPTPPQSQAQPVDSGTGPTLDDFFSDRAPQRSLPAEQGWRAGLRRLSGGAIRLAPGKREQAERNELAAIQRVFDGPRTIVVVNPKGGAHKTTATLMIAAMFGMHRGGYTLAWDNNETRGTLGWRSQPGKNHNTAVDLLRELPHFEVSGGATIADVDRYVRNQGDAKFDVLASDDDAASAAIIDDDAFSRLHTVLSRFYRVMVIDTGNNMRASNWEAALEVADQLVIISTAREDTAASAAWLADGLRERGYADKLANAVTILSSPSAKEDAELTRKLRKHFEALTREVVAVPYDHEFVGGGPLNIHRLAPQTLQAWRHAAAVIAKGL